MLPVRLRGVAAVAVATAELLEVVVQVAHRRLLLRGGGEEASGSASIAAICFEHRRQLLERRIQHRRAVLCRLAVVVRLIRFLRMLHFPSRNRCTKAPERRCLLPWCQSIRVSVTARLERRSGPSGRCEQRETPSRFVRLVCCSPAPHGALLASRWRSPGEALIARVINPGLKERR